MPSNDRFKAVGLALALAIATLGVVFFVGWEPVPDREFRENTGPKPMVEQSGSGLHLPLEGGR
jgi:hypothetical protein